MDFHSTEYCILTGSGRKAMRAHQNSHSALTIRLTTIFIPGRGEQYSNLVILRGGRRPWLDGRSNISVSGSRVSPQSATASQVERPIEADRCLTRILHHVGGTFSSCTTTTSISFSRRFPSPLFQTQRLNTVAAVPAFKRVREKPSSTVVVLQYDRHMHMVVHLYVPG